MIDEQPTGQRIVLMALFSDGSMWELPLHASIRMGERWFNREDTRYSIRSGVYQATLTQESTRVARSRLSQQLRKDAPRKISESQSSAGTNPLAFRTPRRILAIHDTARTSYCTCYLANLSTDHASTVGMCTKWSLWSSRRSRQNHEMICKERRLFGNMHRGCMRSSLFRLEGSRTPFKFAKSALTILPTKLLNVLQPSLGG